MAAIAGRAAVDAAVAAGRVEPGAQVDSFMIVVVLSPVENLRTVVLDAVRNFGAANTLLAIVDSEMCEQGWYQEAAATAGSCGSRATLVTVSGAGSKG